MLKIIYHTAENYFGKRNVKADKATAPFFLGISFIMVISTLILFSTDLDSSFYTSSNITFARESESSPTITNISLDKEAVKDGIIIKITVNVASEAPLTSLNSKFCSPYGTIYDHLVEVVFFENEDGLWEYHWSDFIPNSAPDGHYEYSQIYVVDESSTLSKTWTGELSLNIQSAKKPETLDGVERAPKYIEEKYYYQHSEKYLPPVSRDDHQQHWHSKSSRISDPVYVRKKIDGKTYIAERSPGFYPDCPSLQERPYFDTERAFHKKEFETFSTQFSGDNNPPIIDISSISVSPQTVEPGDTVTVSATITDDLSGVLDVGFSYRSPSNNRSMWFWYYYQQDGLLSVDFTDSRIIGPYKEAGIWQLDYIYVYDHAGNYREYSREDLTNPSQYDFTVINQNGDSEPPVLDISSISVSPQVVEPGDTVTVSATITDDLSGVRYVELSYISPSGEQWQWFSWSDRWRGYPPGPLQHSFNAQIVVDRFEEAGVWQLDYIYLSDHAGNSRSYARSDLANPSQYDYTVINPNSDLEPPVLETGSISVSPQVVEPGDTVTFSASVSDDISGVSYVRAYYSSPSGHRWSKDFSWRSWSWWGGWYDEFEPEPYFRNFKFRDTLTIGPYAEAGLWQFDYIVLEDIAGNYRYYGRNDFSEPEKYDFTVINQISDTNAPLLDLASANADPQIAEIGDTITFTVSVSDDLSGVAEIGVVYKRDNWNYWHLFNQWYDQPGLTRVNFSDTFYIFDDYYAGEWTFDSIYLYDHAGNERQYYRSDFTNPESLDFEVVKSPPDYDDTVAPVLFKDSVSVSPKNVSWGDTVNFSATVADNLSGINLVEVWYSSRTQSWSIGSSRRHSSPGPLITTVDFSFSIWQDMIGTWEFEGLLVTDQAGNYSLYRRSDFANPTQYDFTIYQPSTPQTPLLLAPPDEDNISGSSILLQWSEVENATRYFLTVYDADYYEKLFHGDVGNVAEIFVDGFQSDGREYYWQVAAGKELNWGYYSEPRSFINENLTGSIQVFIEPQAAIDAGAKWRLTTGHDTDWKDSGEIVTGLTPDTYTITFKEIGGLNSPSDVGVGLQEGESVTIDGP